MQQDFESTMNEFLAKVRTHFESRDATVAEYEQFFKQARQAFSMHADFVEQVHDVLTSLQGMIPEAKKVKSLVKFENQIIKNILIVDDAEINRVLMSHLFKTLPVKLEFANSGTQALEKISKQNFDLILMDLQMKEMSGIDAIKAIRNSYSELKIQIVAISNLEPSEDERKLAINAGATEYLSKSMTREVVREKVAEILFGTQTISA